MIRKRGKGVWFCKAVCGLARLPLLVLNRFCKYVVNPNIGFLLFLLGVVFAGGTCYRFNAIKESRPRNGLRKVCTEFKLLALATLENRPACFFYDWSKAVALFITDREYREKICAGCRETDWKDARAWSADHMFDFGSVSKSLKSDSKWEGVVACFLFLFTWLIGGGGIIGSIITTMKYLHDGGWRRWRWLLWNHTVILGWDENGITVIREHLESQRCGKWAMPERFIVLTSQDVNDVERKIQTFFRTGRRIERWIRRCTVRIDIYKGEYDDASELELLHLGRANAIYVLGEKSDLSHDARMLMLSRSIGNELRSGHRPNSEIKMELHLSSFGLFCQQWRVGTSHSAEGKACSSNTGGRYLRNYFGSGRIVEVVCRNFFDSWAKRLFANCRATLDRKVHSQSANVFLKQDTDSSNNIHLVLVGFSEMGQALALQAARVAHYDDVFTYVTVFDDELQTHEDEFRALFPRIDEIPDIHWTFMPDVAIGSKSFIDMIGDFANANDQLTIAIACPDAAVGMKLAIPIQHRVMQCDGGPKQILLCQDVIGRVMPKDEEAPFLNNGPVPIRVFGLRDGAGYNAWFRDIYAAEAYRRGLTEKKGNNSGDGGSKENEIEKKWREISVYDKSQYELPFDCCEEMLRQQDWSDLEKFGKIVKAILTAERCLGNDETIGVDVLKQLEAFIDEGSKDWNNQVWSNEVVKPFKYMRDEIVRDGEWGNCV